MADQYIPMRAFRAYCIKVLPLVYDQSISYYEVLGKVLDVMEDMINNMDHMHSEITVLQVDVADLQRDVATLFDEFEKVKNGEYVSLYLDSIIAWIDANLQQLVARIVQYVFFGLSDDGYFVAEIPESWGFLEFDTVYDYESELYGSLMLRW